MGYRKECCGITQLHKHADRMGKSKYPYVCAAIHMMYVCVDKFIHTQLFADDCFFSLYFSGIRDGRYHTFRIKYDTDTYRDINTVISYRLLSFHLYWSSHTGQSIDT